MPKYTRTNRNSLSQFMRERTKILWLSAPLTSVMMPDGTIQTFVTKGKTFKH